MLSIETAILSIETSIVSVEIKIFIDSLYSDRAQYNQVFFRLSACSSFYYKPGVLFFFSFQALRDMLLFFSLLRVC